MVLAERSAKAGAVGASSASEFVVAQTDHAETPVIEPPQTPAAASAPTLLDTPLPKDDYLRQLDALSVTDKQAALTLVEKGDEWYLGEAPNLRRAARCAVRCSSISVECPKRDSSPATSSGVTPTVRIVASCKA